MGSSVCSVADPSAQGLAPLLSMWQRGVLSEPKVPTREHLVCYAEVHRAGSQETDFRLNFLERK